jgi:hypothetical protein
MKLLAVIVQSLCRKFEELKRWLTVVPDWDTKPSPDRSRTRGAEDFQMLQGRGRQALLERAFAIDPAERPGSPSIMEHARVSNMDSLNATRDLQSAGLPQSQAEAIIGVINDFVSEKPVTNGYLDIRLLQRTLATVAAFAMIVGLFMFFT